LPRAKWKDVVALAPESLCYRQGRYYYVTPVSLPRQEELSKIQIVAHIVRRIIDRHQAHTAQRERRQQDRIDYVQPVQVLTADRRELTLLSRDLSTTGIRLIGTRSLLGQKLRVCLPATAGVEPCCFLVRVLWTCAIGDDLYENGGDFVE